MKKKATSGCPDYPDQCSKQDARQNPITNGQRKRITGKAAEYAEGAMMCSYCGLIYVPKVQNALRLGWLDNAIVGAGFRPTKDPI